MEEKILFFIVMYCCYGIFLQSWINNAKRSDGEIVRKVRNIELWPITCVMKYWRLDLSFKKKKESSPPPPPPPTCVSIPKNYQSFHDPQSEVRQRFYQGFTKAKVLPSNCIRSLDYLCVNRLRQFIRYMPSPFYTARVVLSSFMGAWSLIHMQVLAKLNISDLTTISLANSSWGSNVGM